jgi:hypothetical protein
VRGICGPNSNDYGLGDCGVRWAFVLAVIAFFDCWILGMEIGIFSFFSVVLIHAFYLQDALHSPSLTGR